MFAHDHDDDDESEGEGNSHNQSDDEQSEYSGLLGKPNSFWLRHLTAPPADGIGAMTMEDTGAHGHSWTNIRPFLAPDETITRQPPDKTGQADTPRTPQRPAHEQTPTPLASPALGKRNAQAAGQPPRGQSAAGDGSPPPSAQQGRLFADRYGASVGAGSPGSSTSGYEGGSSMRPTSNFYEDRSYYSSATLIQRRAEDERLTGRHWPSNVLSSPNDPDEAAYFDRLAIALGEVSPRALARASALRYVRAASSAQDDPLLATDIYSIIYYGLGLTVRPLDCSTLPQVLAVYHRGTRDIYLDWQLLQNPPIGAAALDPAAWRRVVDSSPLARFLLAWCAAVHLTDNYDIPLVLGFAPVPVALAQAAATGAQSTGAPIPIVSSDTLNRYRKAMEAVETLLAPAQRLWQQIASLNLPIHMGERDWRARIRAFYRYPGPSRPSTPNLPNFPGVPGAPGSPLGPSFGAQYPPYGGRPTGAPGGQGAPQSPGASIEDPAEQLIRVLAERNNCPRLFVESQLDGAIASPDWAEWSQRLTQEITALHMRYLTAARLFSMASANGAPGWGVPPLQGGSAAFGRQPPQNMQLILSL